MKTANIPVYGNIALSVYKEYICTFTIKTPRALVAHAPFGLLIVKTLTHVLYYKDKYNLSCQHISLKHWTAIKLWTIDKKT